MGKSFVFVAIFIMLASKSNSRRINSTTRFFRHRISTRIQLVCDRRTRNSISVMITISAFIFVQGYLDCTKPYKYSPFLQEIYQNSIVTVVSGLLEKVQIVDFQLAKRVFLVRWSTTQKKKKHSDLQNSMSGQCATEHANKTR